MDNDYKKQIEKRNGQKFTSKRTNRKKYGVSFEEFSVALGDAELFKKVFLLPKYRPDQIMREINEELQQIKEFEDMGCPLTEAEIKEKINRINDRKSKLSEYKFELILTEC